MIKRIIRFIYNRIKTLLYKSSMGRFGEKSVIINPLKINGKKRIFIGDKVVIEYKTWLAAMPLTRYDDCKLEIKDGVNIGHFNHIYATKSIIIEENVLTADRVYISDNLHRYDDINVPIKLQPIIQKKEVVIGKGSWLGENVCVIGAKIGKHCVIGANSVVTHDIPDYCVAVGSPAKIIKRYDFSTRTWKETNYKGEFID